MNKIIALVITFTILVFPVPGNAQLYDQKVKITTNNYCASIDPAISYAVPGTVNVSFTPGRTATIAPGGSDPGVRTANPITMNPCTSYILTFNNVNQGAEGFTVRFNSLKDIGTWNFSIVNQIEAPTSWCELSGPCGFRCDVNHAYIGTLPCNITYNVTNDAPNGSVTYAPHLTASVTDWGKMVTLDGNGSDPDGGAVNYTWSILQKPAGSLANLSATNIRSPTIVFNHEQDIGNWRFKVHIDDDEGERKTFEGDVVVPNVAPAISLSITPSNPLNVLQTLGISATPTTDTDGGGAFIFNWVVSGPHPYSGPTTNSSISFVTNETDITTFSDGTDFRPLWHFECTARDNENATDVKTANIRVKNKPPVINVGSYAEEIDIGGTISIATSVMNDEDGGTLTFKWDIIQAPNSAPIGIQSNHSTLSSISIPTTAAHAGTWRFKLTAKDNEGEEKTENFSVLVDAPPVAHIAGPLQTIGSIFGFPLTLDGNASEDPDSKDNCASHCHTTSDPPVQVSGGITKYTWYLLEAPEDNPNIFALGRVDDVLGINSSSPTLVIPFSKRLTPGIYSFQLQVEDAEGNTDTEDYLVDVAEEESKPISFIIPPYIIQYVDPLTNILATDISFNGSFSFDMDNLLSSPITAGISAYEWLILTRPPGCPLSFSLPSGASATTATLFTAGTLIDPICQGLWKIGLKVTDDDAIPKINDPITEATVVIGNCPSNLCIDYPTTANAQTIQFSSKTDVTIYFHLNSILYSDPAALYGTIALLEIFYEAEATPFYSVSDPNLFPTDFGGYLMFHWNGYGVGNTRPRNGRYHIKLTLLNELFGITIGGDYKANAILIQVANPAISATSDRYIDRDKLQAGTDNVSINYDITGGGTPTALRWKIYDAGNAVVKQVDIPSPPGSGTINWNGINDAAVLVPTGDYEVELETLDGASSMGKSSKYKFSIIQCDIDADITRDGTIDNTTDDVNENIATLASGAIFNVNYDRDGTRTSGAVPIGDALHINDDGDPGNEDLVIDNAADVPDITPFIIRKITDFFPATFHVFLKAGSLEDIQSIHVFKKILAGETAIWGGLGSRTGGAPIPTEIDITQWVNPSSPTYQGDPAGNVTFGLEGLFFRNTGVLNTFDGVVQFTLELRDGATIVASDQISLKVAPWLMVSHAQASSEVWVLNDVNNAAMRLNASANPGYFGLDNSTQMQMASDPEAGTQWFQDHLEIGYYQRPGGTKDHCVFRLPYFRSLALPQPLWPELSLLSAGTGTFQMAKEVGGESGDYGGNLELLPANAMNKNGKIVVGTRRSTQFNDFLTSQEVQPVFPVNTHWLRVGHVDEIFGFSGNTNEVIVADPTDAYTQMTSIPAADRGKSVFFATGPIPVDGAVSSNTATPNRINTGVDHTVGPAWNYIRIYRATASGAQGQTAHIAPGGLQNGFILVDQVWNTGSQVLPEVVGNYGKYIHSSLAPSSVNWFASPQVGDRYVLVEDTRFWRTGTPSIITVEEILADSELEDLNKIDAQNEINTIRATLLAEAGMPVNFIKVPTIYIGQRLGFSSSKKTDALTPGLANFQSVNGKLYFPRQFGPKNSMGQDIFEKITLSRVPQALFTDDWDMYHAAMGEVHCGTNTKRVLPFLNWW